MNNSQPPRTAHRIPDTRSHLHLVAPPDSPPTAPERTEPDRVEVFLDMGYVRKSAETAFGPHTGSQVPDPLTTAWEIVRRRRWRSELGAVHVFDGIHDPVRRPGEHQKTLAWKQKVEAGGRVIVHLRPLQYLPDGSFRQKEVDTAMSFAIDDATRSSGLAAIVAFTGDRDLREAARRVLHAGVRFESACWGQRGGLFVPGTNTWTHRLDWAAHQHCIGSHEFDDAA